MAYNTIFEFLRFDAAVHFRSGEAEEFLACWRAAAKDGVPRSETNVRYFRWWQGRSVMEVAWLGERWADLQAGSPAQWPSRNLRHLSWRGTLETGGRFEEALVGYAKARAVASHADEHGVDLTASFAYGDHHSDLPFMALAGESMLVSPAVYDVPAPVA